eukprot:UN15509
MIKRLRLRFQCRQRKKNSFKKLKILVKNAQRRLLP